MDCSLKDIIHVLKDDISNRCRAFGSREAHVTLDETQREYALESIHETYVILKDIDKVPTGNLKCLVVQYQILLKELTRRYTKDHPWWTLEIRQSNTRSLFRVFDFWWPNVDQTLLKLMGETILGVLQM